MEYSREYLDECKKINEMILDTPHSSRQKVEKYHSDIIECLDAGTIITVPSQMHRNLHQAMWVKAHEIYNNLLDNLVVLNGFEENGNRKRFDIWYARVYILEKKLNAWELKTLIDAAEESIELYKHPLEELVISDLLPREEVAV